jgi:hypothetical protein
MPFYSRFSVYIDNAELGYMTGKKTKCNAPANQRLVIVSVDLGVNHCDVYRRRYSLRKHGRSAIEGRTVRDLTQRLEFLLTSQIVRT